MNDGVERRFTIFGAGLAGALMAIHLSKQGERVELYERRPDPRVGDVDAGRSINLALSRRGLSALNAVGLDDAVLASAIPMRGRMLHDTAGELTFQPYGHRKEQAINSVSRAGLNQLLIEAADASPNVTIHFGARCRKVDFDRHRAEIEWLDGARREEITPGIIIGADGAFSAVRLSMQLRDRFSFSQEYLPHGYKELTIPPTADGEFALDPHALHIWPRGGFMMIALPNADRSFTCTLFWPHEGPNSAAVIDSVAAARDFFERQFPDALKLMPTFDEDFARNPHSSLATMRCEPWHVGRQAVLIGDASHAIVPFFGQGMNAAFEDCRILSEMIQESGGADIADVFASFSARRKPNAEAIADLALANYVEMRDTVSSPLFRLKKAIERTLARFLPGYTPLYEMISFTNIPYAQALAIAQRRRRSVQGAIVLLALVILVILARVV